MIGIEVRLLAGRYHANDWHHSHNEGVPEWPPSPWRILRALVSAAYAEGLAPESVAPLIEKLRGLPRYQLPPAIDAHTRHYMPDTDDANHTRAKVFDTFVAVEGGARCPRPLTIAWDAELTHDERALLDRLARRITYLGRAESWAELTPVSAADGDWSCWPDEHGLAANSTTLLVLAPPEQLTAWATKQPGAQKGGGVPRTAWDVLTFDGRRYRAEGWSDIPGTLRARYVFAAPPFQRVPRSRRVETADRNQPTVARYAIRSAVLPRIEESISIGERLREGMMSCSKKVSGNARPVFSGHGDAAPSNHQHAMYLPTSELVHNRNEKRIDHLTVVARAGFADEEVVALQQLRWLWGRDGHDLELILIGLGTGDELGGQSYPCSRILANSAVWQSVTPFVPTRYPKLVRGQDVDGIADQIRLACEQLLGTRPIEVVPAGGAPTWSGFRRRRQGGGRRRGPDRAYGARLVFERPIPGPIALRYGSHFGLGLFEPVSG